MTILLTGASGLLGSALTGELTMVAPVVAGTHQRDLHSHRSIPLNVDDPSSVALALDSVAPSICVHGAAMTSARACEQDPSAAWRVNAMGTFNLAAACATRRVKLVFISTQYVFPGDSSQPYDEGDAPRPLQTYGMTKWMGERATADTPKNLIVRIPTLYRMPARAHDKGLVGATLTALARDEPIAINDRETLTPTEVGEAAQIIARLIQREVRGVVHVAAQESIGPREWAGLIARAHGAERCEFVEKEDPTRRPSHAVLAVRRLAELGIDPPTAVHARFRAACAVRNSLSGRGLCKM